MAEDRSFLPIVLSPWQRIPPPSLLSYLHGRGSFLPPYCLISLTERLISSLPVISSASGTPGALVSARERVSVDKLGDQGRGFTAQSDCSSVASLVSVITKGVHHHNDSSARASACQSVAVMRATPRRGRRLSVMLRRRLLRGWILRPLTQPAPRLARFLRPVLAHVGLSLSYFVGSRHGRPWAL